MKLRDTENIWVLSIFLGITGVIAGTVLAWVSQLTAEPIKQADINNELKVLKELNLPEFDNDMTSQIFTVNGVEYLAAMNKGKLTGLAARVQSNSGYSGRMRALVSFNTAGNILAVQVIEHKETPGLGAEVCERKFQRTIFNLFSPRPAGLPPNAVLDQFNGKNAAESGNWKITRDGGEFIYRTGATISSRAITEMVNNASVNFKAALEHFSGENSK